MHSTSPSHGSIQHKHAAYALRGIGAFWRYLSGSLIRMVQALELGAEYKADRERDGMRVLLLLVVQVQVVARIFPSKYTRTSTNVRRARNRHDV